MNIEITPDYRITTDALNFIVNQRHTVDPTKAPVWAKREAEGADPTPRIEWREVSYHGTLEGALHSMTNRIVRQSDAETIAELLNLIREIKSQIDNALST